MQARKAKSRMGCVDLTSDLLARVAGWRVMQEARALLAGGNVQESSWAPPRLEGVVREGGTKYRTGLVLHSAIDVDTLCSCRRARIEGAICIHAVAAGLHWLATRQAAPHPIHPSPPAREPTATTVRKDAASGHPGSRATEPQPRRALRRAAPGEAAEEIEIRIIFPPNLEQAMAKGKVMLVFEAVRSGRCVPLNMLPLDAPFLLSPADASALDTIETLTADGVPAMLLLGGSDLGQLLPKLAGHSGLSLGRGRPLEISLDAISWPVRATLEASGQITLRLDGSVPTVLATGEVDWCLRENRLQPLRLPTAARGLARGPIRLERSRVPAFLVRDWPALVAAGHAQANFDLSDFVLETEPPRFRLRLEGGLARIEARLTCDYAGHAVAPVHGVVEPLCFPDAACPTRYTLRDSGAEHAALERLAQWGFTGPDRNNRFLLDGETAVLNFFARVFPRLQREWDIELEPRLDGAAKTRLERIEPELLVMPSGEQWFDLSVAFASAGGERFSAADIQRLVLAGQSHVRLRNGRLALIDTGAVEELQQVLLDCEPQQTAAGYRLANAQADFVQSTLREHAGWQLEAPRAWLDRTARPADAAAHECPPLGSLDAVLRPYQKQGVAWLWFLRKHGFGGILADEMGLGKTLQTLAVVAAAQAQTEPGSGPLPSLVVCPTSLVFNWVAEAARFVPGLRVLPLHGLERQARFAEIPRHDLVVTSYALIRRDLDRYRALEFDTVVLDEAQHIKNRETQNAQAVKAIRARHRLVLTGTPLENSVLDLWSIFDFLMPGYLGKARDFRERYEIPITRDRDAAVRDRLARRVRAFLLRRVKRDVAPDLPEKIEQVALCDLTSDQATVYRQVLETGRREIVETVGVQGLARSRMIILTTLLRLRQVCCDLRLLDLPGVEGAAPSGKLDLFEELIEEVIDGGHRALVFSQFTSMLALIRDRLTDRGIEFCYLDGATPDRGGVVRHFQDHTDIPVFLISLKAGGAGLNLTGADTVIHFDPWWNPAVEAQATDRAHRLGQKRVVTSYRLIARGTVEEKILGLQSRKREVIDALLGGEDQPGGDLTWEEIQDLLA